MRKWIVIICLVGVVFLSAFTIVLQLWEEPQGIAPAKNIISNTPTQMPTPTVTPTPLPIKKILENDYHIFQSFNNCGPAALSMALSYFGVNKTQYELGQELRPYQNPQGDNDDKSVTLDELAVKAEALGFVAFHRPNGNREILRQFLANDIPIIARTWLNEYEDVGHYRVIKGYDDAAQQLLQDDSLQGKNLWYSYDSFDTLWEKFNYEYLVFIPKEKETIARQILGENADVKRAWEKAGENARRELKINPEDIYARFNLSIALYHTGDYQNAITEFEKIESQLPFRTLWYQIEPIQAYVAVKNYDKVLTMIERILNYHNRAFSELYVIRGKIYQEQGNREVAEDEFEKAMFYNKNIQI